MKKYSKIECHNMIVNSKFPIDPFTMYINENFKTVEEMDKIVKEANKFFEVQNMTESDIKRIIDAELESNLHVLIDPKKKDSFSSSRIQTWKNLVAERIYKHCHTDNVD